MTYDFRTPNNPKIHEKSRRRDSGGNSGDGSKKSGGGSKNCINMGVSWKSHHIPMMMAMIMMAKS